MPIGRRRSSASWPSKPGGSGQQSEAAQQLDRQTKISKGRAADPGSVQRQPAAENLIMDAADRLEQLQVRSAETLLRRDLDQHRRTRVFDLVHRMAEAGDETSR